MTKKHGLIGLGVALLACGVALALEQTTPEKPAPEPEVLFEADFESGLIETAKLPVGRFQVVTGVADVPGQVILLDTAAGQTWVLCAPRANEKAWCPLPRRLDQAEPVRP